MCEPQFTSASHTHSCATLSLSETLFFFLIPKPNILPGLDCLMDWITRILRRLHGQVQVGLASKTEGAHSTMSAAGGAPLL